MLKRVMLRTDLCNAGNARWAAVDYQYFVVAAVARKMLALQSPGFPDAIELTYQLLFETLPPGQTKTLRYTLYAGPKSSDELKAEWRIHL